VWDYRRKDGVDPKLSQAWIPLSRISEIAQVEPALVILGLCVGSWLFYRLALRKVTDSRHGIFRDAFRNLAWHLAAAIPLFCAYLWLSRAWLDNASLERVASYVGLLAIISGATVFVKVSRILVFEYLFFSHMREGVPMLLNNLFTLGLSLVMAGWIATAIFNVRLTPLLATSAIFSLVLGLALQDTLGNLFAGVALQFDKPYELGDWIEVHGPDAQKWVGQVNEISWRATVLDAFTEESITIPNRVMAQAQVSNFATRRRPIIRSQIFRLPYGTDRARAKAALIRAAARVPGVRAQPAITVLMMEAAESWVVFKLIYYVDDFGRQYSIGDQVIAGCLEELDAEDIECANPRLQLKR
jgi:small-conductance mechanosensitive channel